MHSKKVLGVVAHAVQNTPDRNLDIDDFSDFYSLLRFQLQNCAVERLGIKTDSKLMASYTLCLGTIARLFFPYAIVGSPAVPSVIYRYRDV